MILRGEATGPAFGQRMVGKVLKPALKQGMKTSLWLLKLTIPVSLAVFLAGEAGLLTAIAGITEPFFRVLGIPGRASVVLITGYFTNIYSVIAVMATLGLTVREGLIVANMCLIAHSLVVETGIQKKTGSRGWRMIILRLTASFLAAWLLNLLLPDGSQPMAYQPALADEGFSAAFRVWLRATAVTSLKIVVLVNLLLILQKLLHFTGMLKWLERPFTPLMGGMGLPRETSFLWLVANTLGLSYGGAIMISQVAEGVLKQRDADLLNHHVAVSHSQLEDTLLFAAMGFSIAWLFFPRFLLAVAFTWLYRLECRLRGAARAPA